MSNLTAIRRPSPPISSTLRSIAFLQVEGPIEDQHRATFAHWADLNQHIWEVALYVPQGHAHRCEITVTWDDGRMFEFIFMLERKHALGFADAPDTIVVGGRA